MCVEGGTVFFLLCPQSQSSFMPPVCLHLLSRLRVITTPVTPDLKPKMVGGAGQTRDCGHELEKQASLL